MPYAASTERSITNPIHILYERCFEACENPICTYIAVQFPTCARIVNIYVIIKIANFFLSDMNVGYAADCLLCTVYACRL